MATYSYLMNSNGRFVRFLGGASVHETGSVSTFTFKDDEGEYTVDVIEVEVDGEIYFTQKFD